MLPDLRSLKAVLANRLSDGVQAAAAHHAPLVGQIKVYRQKEGDRYSYETHEGEIRHETFKRFRTPVTTRILPSPIEQEQEIGRKLDDASRSIAQQHMQLLFTSVTESSQRVGTAYEAAGKPFDMGMFVDALETMWLDFDEHGQPQFPTIVMHPDQMKVVGPKLAEWEKDRALLARLAEVVARKKEEWRAREADRALVG
jgi:hypothetical protein